MVSWCAQSRAGWGGSQVSVCVSLVWQRILTAGRNHSSALTAERAHQQAVKTEISVLVHKLALSFYSSVSVFRWVCGFSVFVVEINRNIMTLYHCTSCTASLSE